MHLRDICLVGSGVASVVVFVIDPTVVGVAVGVDVVVATVTVAAVVVETDLYLF